MLEVFQQPDGRFVVRNLGGPNLDNVLGLFDTQAEAEEFLLSQEMLLDDRESGLGIMKPGGNQGLR
jgi:hypothetical protein